MTITVFLLLLYFGTAFPEQAHIGSEQWVDPHDMNVDFNYNYVTPERLPTRDYQIAKHSTSQSEDPTLEYLKRFLSLMLNSASKSGTGSILVGSYVLDKDSFDYQFLSEFVKHKTVGAEELRKLDTILSNAFASTASDQILDSVLSVQEKILNVLYSCNILLVIPFAIYIVHKLLQSNFSFWYISRYILLMVLIFDYGLRYKMLLEETEKHNMEIKYTSKCDTRSMTWTQWLWYVTDTQTCKEKQVVNPLDVFLHQVKHMIVVPVSAIGTGIGSFGKEMWTELGYPWNLLIFPILLVFTLLMTAILLTAANNKSFKIKLFHLLHFEFGDQQHQPKAMEVNIHLPVDNQTRQNLQIQQNDNISRNGQLLEIEDTNSKTKVSPQSQTGSAQGAISDTVIATKSETVAQQATKDIEIQSTHSDCKDASKNSGITPDNSTVSSNLECFDENSCSDYGSSASSHCDQEYEIISNVDDSESDKDKTVT